MFSKLGAILGGTVGIFILVLILFGKSILPAAQNVLVDDFHFFDKVMSGTPSEALEYYTSKTDKPSVTSRDIKLEKDGRTLKYEVKTQTDAFLDITLSGPGGQQAIVSGDAHETKGKLYDLVDGEYVLTVVPYRCVEIELELREKLGKGYDYCFRKDGFKYTSELTVDQSVSEWINASAQIDVTRGDDGDFHEVVRVSVENKDLSGYKLLQVGSYKALFNGESRLTANVPAKIANKAIRDNHIAVTVVDHAGNKGVYAVGIDTYIANGTAILDQNNDIQGVGKHANCYPIIGCPPGFVRAEVANGRVVSTEEYSSLRYYGSIALCIILIVVLGTVILMPILRGGFRLPSIGLRLPDDDGVPEE